MTDAILGDREWIRANPTRYYRIIHRSTPNTAGVVYADITSIGTDRNIWSRQRITMRSELPDTDVAALLALEERNTAHTFQAGY